MLGARPVPRAGLDYDRPMKLMLCRFCADVVALRPEVERACLCGRSRGRYLDDRSTAVQTEGTISIALNNHDLRDAIAAYDEQPEAWHPLLTLRAYLNPTCEADVRYEPAPEEPSEAS